MSMPTREELIAWEKERSHVDMRPAALVTLTDLAVTTADYNRFLYELTRFYRPAVMVETGTDRGRSAAHMACGNRLGRVFTLDIDPACSAEARGLEWANVITWTGESLALVDRFPSDSIDLLYLDSLHTYEHTKAEWEAFKPKLRKGALVLIDDITLDAGMQRFWAELPEPKLELNHLHFSGFGAWWPESC